MCFRRVIQQTERRIESIRSIEGGCAKFKAEEMFKSRLVLAISMVSGFIKGEAGISGIELRRNSTSCSIRIGPVGSKSHMFVKSGRLKAVHREGEINFHIS